MRSIEILRSSNSYVAFNEINVHNFISIHFICRSQGHNQSKDNTDACVSKNKKLINQNSTEESAIVIQKVWRGYSTRKTNKHIAENLQKNRTQQHIEYETKPFQICRVLLAYGFHSLIYFILFFQQTIA